MRSVRRWRVFDALGGETLYSFATTVNIRFGNRRGLCTCRSDVEDLNRALEQAVQV
jgi:hypothetical protein